jgi:hypothetical protein
LASPNPDDGLVPEISDLYKRNPKKWEKEAMRRTEEEATVSKLEEVERGLDGDGVGESNKSDGKENTATNDKANNNTDEKERDNGSKKRDANVDGKVESELEDSKRAKR